MANTVFKILIVDDDKTAANAMAEVVKRMGYKPIVTNKSADALNLVRLQTVHAAIVDVLLPKMTGVELVTEFRTTKFADNPVIFVSGVFKDKAFANDTLKKTGASGFLFKPYEVNDLVEAIKKALQPMITAERWTVESMLTKNFASDRERIKAIEHLEEIRGNDFPFFLSFLLGMQGAGHLNMVNENGEIYGVSLVYGTISEIDGPESQSSAVVNLISQGFLSQEDWDEYHAQGGKRFTLDKLVDDGLVSPHAVAAIRHEQIIADFRSICASAKLKVNFSVHESKEYPPRHAVNFSDILGLCMVSAEEFFSEQYLSEFYASVKDSPMSLIVDAAAWEQTWNISLYAHLDALKDQIENHGTIQGAINQSPDDAAEIYICLNHLVISRVLVFQDLSHVRNSTQMLERLSKLYKELEGKTADKIFEYFGATHNASQAVIQNIYDEYMKANSPDALGSEVANEVRELSLKCFALVKEAYEVMTDDEKRAALADNIKSLQAEKLSRSQTLMRDGLETLRRGQTKEALAKLREAESLSSNNLLVLIRTWAEIKCGVSKARAAEISKQLDGVVGDERKSAYYFMASGLIKKELGDVNAAASFFERVLDLDSQFAEARRELRSLQANLSEKTSSGAKKDIFNTDITSVFANVTNIFKRKAE